MVSRKTAEKNRNSKGQKDQKGQQLKRDAYEQQEVGISPISPKVALLLSQGNSAC